MTGFTRQADDWDATMKTYASQVRMQGVISPFARLGDDRVPPRPSRPSGIGRPGRDRGRCGPHLHSDSQFSPDQPWVFIIDCMFSDDESRNMVTYRCSGVRCPPLPPHLLAIPEGQATTPLPPHGISENARGVTYYSPPHRLNRWQYMEDALPTPQRHGNGGYAAIHWAASCFLFLKSRPHSTHPRVRSKGSGAVRSPSAFRFPIFARSTMGFYY